MSKKSWMILLTCLTTVLLFLVGCTGSAAPTPTTAPPTLPPPTAEPTATATTVPPTETVSVTAEPCNVTAQSDITAYQRPSLEASVFGTLGSGESVQVGMQSVDGWLGFEPGVAQAANVGVFRLRWIPPTADASQSGGCSMLPIAPEISPTACYFMAFDDTPLHADSDGGSAVVATIPG
ncbi:MAG: hypothetical protein WAM60_20775, partial [Candidatus Promineifilaceae bacterium]